MRASPTFRKEMAAAWSVPALLFVVLPGTVLLFAPPFLDALMGMLLSISILLAPAFLVGFALAPWAGRQAPTTKAPAFIMSALAAGTSAGVMGILAQSPAVTAFVAFFTLPSLIGALLFIGACERSTPLMVSDDGND